MNTRITVWPVAERILLGVQSAEYSMVAELSASEARGVRDNLDELIRMVESGGSVMPDLRKFLEILPDAWKRV